MIGCFIKATALDAPANASAEQPIVGGSLSSERQAEKEEGLILTLESAAANTQLELSSDGKDKEKVFFVQEIGDK